MKKATLTLMLALATTFAWAGNKTKSLTKVQAKEVEKEVVAEWKASEKARLAYIMADKTVKAGSLAMPIHWQICGTEPADGRSLFISIHGCGATEQAKNEQRHNQCNLDKSKEGVYLCLRTPYNGEDTHFNPLLDKCYRDIINFCVTNMNVNPDKVYIIGRSAGGNACLKYECGVRRTCILGYSAGGDAVWRIAPRMADSWAAASMMAQHPGNEQLNKQHDTPFTIWCGALDNSYNRNKIDAQCIAKTDSLQSQNPENRKCCGQTVEGKPYKTDCVDTLAISWMEQYKRNPYPKTIVWNQDAHQSSAYYWLKVKPKKNSRHKEVYASYDGNTVTIEKCDYKHLTICLNDQMMDLDKPVKVIFNGKTIFNGKVKRTRKNMERNLKLRQDERYAFPAEIKITHKKSGNWFELTVVK